MKMCIELDHRDGFVCLFPFQAITHDPWSVNMGICKHLSLITLFDLWTVKSLNVKQRTNTSKTHYLRSDAFIFIFQWLIFYRRVQSTQHWQQIRVNVVLLFSKLSLGHVMMWIMSEQESTYLWWQLRRPPNMKEKEKKRELVWYIDEFMHRWQLKTDRHRCLR